MGGRTTNSNIPPEMQRALDGEVPFSSGEAFVPPGAASITLEDVLGGAGLFQKVMGIDEESPLWDSDPPSSWLSGDIRDEDGVSTAGASSWSNGGHAEVLRASIHYWIA